MKKQMEKEANLEKIYREMDIGEKIDMLMNKGCLIAAAYAIESLPSECKKKPLYAGMAVVLSKYADKEKAGSDQKKDSSG